MEGCKRTDRRKMEEKKETEVLKNGKRKMRKKGNVCQEKLNQKD